MCALCKSISADDYATYTESDVYVHTTASHTSHNISSLCELRICCSLFLLLFSVGHFLSTSFFILLTQTRVLNEDIRERKRVLIMLLEKQNQIDSFNWMSGKKFAINSFQLVCFHAFYDSKIVKYEMNF